MVAPCQILLRLLKYLKACTSNMFKLISYKEAVEFLLPRHYSGRKPVISYAFGWYQDDVLVAVCTFGKPASNPLCIGVCGKDLSSKVYELNRLYVDGDLVINLSSFVSKCLKHLAKEQLIIISYADTQMEHVGAIYQATNFIYTGATKARTDKFTGDKYSRHYDKTAVEVYRQRRSSKHRYVYFTGSKTFRKACKRALQYPVMDYPKGDKKEYVLGDFIKPDVYLVIK